LNVDLFGHRCLFLIFEGGAVKPPFMNWQQPEGGISHAESAYNSNLDGVGGA
jgi:hypothetical protein